MAFRFFLMVVIFPNLFFAQKPQLQIIGKPKPVYGEIVEHPDFAGRFCAAIRVITQVKGLTYGSYDGIQKEEKKRGYTLLYLTPDEQVLEIYNRNYEILKIILTEVGIGLTPKQVWVIEIGAGEAPATITVRIITHPADADIYVDGVRSADSAHELTAGSHQLQFAKEGYQPLSEDILVDKTNTRFEYTLRKDETIASEDLLKNAREAYSAGNYSESFLLFQLLASKGSAEGQYCLGLHYENGYGNTRDYAEAVRWYHKAAEQGDASSQNNLGFMYQNGRGVAQDYVEAVKWYRKAAEQSNTHGQNNLGFMHQNGNGVTLDYAEAVKWFRKAAEQGNASGQNNLGFMHQNGFGVTRDHVEAVKWYRKAAEQGNADGQYNVGYMYQNGYGVARDYAEAVRWYRKAAAQGYTAAQEELEKLQYQ